MRFIVLLLMVATALAAALPQRHILQRDTTSQRRTSRIVGGTPATIEQYPYMGSVQHLLDMWWMHWCGGSLLTTRTILSAAHCFYEDTLPTTYSVRLGSSIEWSGGTVHMVSRLVLHESYVHETVDNDVAIVHLATPAVLSNTVATARIVAPNFNLPDGTSVTAIGWGVYSFVPEEEAMNWPEQLQRVDIDIINQELCAERYAYLKLQHYFIPDVTDGMVCTGILDVGGKGLCYGDSGGPLVVNQDIVYGVNSWSWDCAHEKYPGVSARVSYYSDWIVANGST